jgi:hypothetical protein
MRDCPASHNEVAAQFTALYVRLLKAKKGEFGMMLGSEPSLELTNFVRFTSRNLLSLSPEVSNQGGE